VLFFENYVGAIDKSPHFFIIMGDDSDAKYAKKCFDVAHQGEMDEFVFGIARARRRG